MDEKNRIVSPEQANWTKILIWTCFTAEVNWAQAQNGGGDSVKLVSAYSIVMVCKGGGREGDFVPQGALAMSGDIFDCWVGVLLASIRERPRMLLNTYKTWDSPSWWKVIKLQVSVVPEALLSRLTGYKGGMKEPLGVPVRNWQPLRNCPEVKGERCS